MIFVMEISYGSYEFDIKLLYSDVCSDPETAEKEIQLSIIQFAKMFSFAWISISTFYQKFSPIVLWLLNLRPLLYSLDNGTHAFCVNVRSAR